MQSRLRETPRARSIRTEAISATDRYSQKSFFRWLVRVWYSLTAPDIAIEPMPDATLEEQEQARHSRFASSLLFVMLLISVAFIPLGINSRSGHVLPIIVGLFIVAIIGIFLNRLAYVTTVGILLVSASMLGCMLTVLTTPDFMLSANDIPVFDLLVLSELVAISLLPPFAILPVALLNSCFIAIDILIQPLAPAVAPYSYALMVRPIALQLVVGLVAYFWAVSGIRAIERANRAELVAKLESSILQQKQELDYGIQQLLYTLVQAANGDTRIRTPLSQENVLWQVGVALNTLLARLQKSGQSEEELKQVRLEIAYLVNALRDAKTQQIPVRVPSRGTHIDEVFRELSGCQVNPPSPFQRGQSRDRGYI